MDDFPGLGYVEKVVRLLRGCRRTLVLKAYHISVLRVASGVGRSHLLICAADRYTFKNGLPLYTLYVITVFGSNEV